MPPILPPPQLATVQTSKPTPEQKTAARFKDLSPAQVRWLDTLEANGILRTSPASEMFGPSQTVRREELLMSEARIVEMILRQEQRQREEIARMQAELAKLESDNRHLAATLAALQAHAATRPTIAVGRIEGEPLPTRVDPLPAPAVAQLSAAPTELLPTLPPAALSEPGLDASPEVQLRPATARLNRPEPPTGSDARIDIALLVRHRHRLGQFPRLGRFLERAGQLDPNSSGYDAYVRTYLATSGLTEGLLREAARQAAWYDTQPLA